MSVRFTQSCPTCGRRVQVRASLIGYTVACQHCNAEFIAEAEGDERCATAPGGAQPSGRITVDPLMARVEDALLRAAQQKTAVN